IPADLNEEFFKSLFPAQSIQTEEEFRAAVREDIQGYWNRQSRNQLQHELYHVLVEQTQIEFPDVFLKKWLQQSREKAKTDAEVEQEFPDFLQQLKWTLITDKIVHEKKIEVSPDDLKKYAQQQLMGYMGMTALQEEQPWMQEYLNRMMQDRKFVEDAYHRIQAEKVLDWAADHVGKQEKSLAVEDFTKELEKHQHHHH
ncbi:MAG: trigger factor, partial [Chitinophagaceae bacterium]